MENVTKEKILLTTDSGLSIPCELAFPEDPRAFVLVTHGFGSSKESSTAQMMLSDLPPAGFGAIAYDFPGHGADKALAAPLTCENCIDYLCTVERYIAERFIFPRIFYFSSSFGAYITLTSFSTDTHLGDRLFLRSAAVNMPDVVTGMADDAAIAELDSQGYYDLDDAGPARVRITKQFFSEMQNGDLFKAASSIPFDDIEVMMVHGEKDMVIDPVAAQRFAAENDIPLIMMPGEDHTLSTDPASPSKVSEMAIEFFSE